MNDVLARQASDIRTRATDQAALDESNAAPGLGECPGQIFSGLAAAKDQNLVTLDLSHDYILAVLRPGVFYCGHRPGQLFHAAIPSYLTSVIMPVCM